MKKLLFTLILASSMVTAMAAAGQGRAAKESRTQAKEKQVETYVQAVLTTTFGEGITSHEQLQRQAWGKRQSAYGQLTSRKSLFFTPDHARRLARVEQVAPEELSNKLLRKLARKYKGYEVAQVIRYDDGDTLYFVSLKKGRQEVFISYAR